MESLGMHGVLRHSGLPRADGRVRRAPSRGASSAASPTRGAWSSPRSFGSRKERWGGVVVGVGGGGWGGVVGVGGGVGGVLGGGWSGGGALALFEVWHIKDGCLDPPTRVAHKPSKSANQVVGRILVWLLDPSTAGYN